MQPVRGKALTEIDHLLEYISKGKGEEDVTEKVKEIRALIWDNPALKDDDALLDKVFKVIECLPDEAIQVQCRSILLGEAPVILTVTERELQEDEDEIWKRIAKGEIKRLVIKQKGDPIIYEKRILKQLLEKKPPIDSLTKIKGAGAAMCDSLI